VPSASSVSRPRLVLATLNPGKVLELTALLAGVPFEVVALAAFPGATLPEEGADSYRDNALLKARAVARAEGAWALGDDSGLEVDALGGAPGVRSARYGGPGLDDRGRCARLLEALAGVPAEQRTARFRCVVALVDPAGHEHLTEGVVEGLIAEAPRGAHGFGYDPVFYYPPRACTFAELASEETRRVDHRGRAVRAARRVLHG
jgi:XTP/dITP diphosphohydrolase